MINKNILQKKRVCVCVFFSVERLQTLQKKAKYISSIIFSQFWRTKCGKGEKQTLDDDWQ